MQWIDSHAVERPATIRCVSHAPSPQLNRSLLLIQTDRDDICRRRCTGPVGRRWPNCSHAIWSDMLGSILKLLPATMVRHYWRWPPGSMRYAFGPWRQSCRRQEKHRLQYAYQLWHDRSYFQTMQSVDVLVVAPPAHSNAHLPAGCADWRPMSPVGLYQKAALPPQCMLGWWAGRYWDSAANHRRRPFHRSFHVAAAYC